MWESFHTDAWGNLIVGIDTDKRDTMYFTRTGIKNESIWGLSPFAYGVAPISRLLESIGLFCKRTLPKRLYSANETYNFKEPTNHSPPIGSWVMSHVRVISKDTWGNLIAGVDEDKRTGMSSVLHRYMSHGMSSESSHIDTWVMSRVWESFHIDTWGNLVVGIDTDKRDTMYFTRTGIKNESIWELSPFAYGVAPISRLLESIGLFCKRTL